EGIGDKMVTLIHNILNTDYVGLIHDDASVKGTYLLHHGREVLAGELGIDRDLLDQFADRMGIPCVCNRLGAIQLAKQLKVAAGQNIVTIATDGFERYPSVMRDLEKREGGTITQKMMKTYLDEIFLGADTREILDTHSEKEKQRLHDLKKEMWTQFGYDEAYLDSMMKMDFWDA